MQLKKKEIIEIKSKKEFTSRYPLVKEMDLVNNTFLAIPLTIENNVIGVIGCSFKDEREFQVEEKVFLHSIANQCTTALERALLFEAEQKLRSGAQQEIERRKKSEDDLRQSEERFRSLVELAPDAIYSLTTDGIFTEPNPAFEKITGWSRSRWIGRSYIDIVHPEDKEKADEEFLSGLQGSISDPYELRLLTKNGKYIVCEFRSKPRIKEGKIIGKLGIFQDITGRKQEEREREYMVGIASHELKTPLATIKAFSQILKKKLLKENINEDYIRYIDRIDQHVNKLTKLIGDMLDITRIRAGRIELKDDIFDFDELIDETVRDIQETISSHTVKVIGKANTYIQADRDRIARVLVNLLSNAIKYSPKADVVELKVESTRSTVIVHITDFGIGIPKDMTHRIFEPFTHITSKARGKIPSVGLGLYISSQLVSFHGGNIWFESESGKGSVFHIQLPIKRKTGTKE